MYVILVYDCGEKRVGKMLKLCRKYLNWIQNSVFEGEISEVKLKELTLKAEEFMKKEEDSLIIFSGRTEKWLDKQIIGKERCSINNFLWCIVGDVPKMVKIEKFYLKKDLWHVDNQSHSKLSVNGVFHTIVHRQHFTPKNTILQNICSCKSAIF